jgi:serine/threonine-protein kinase
MPPEQVRDFRSVRPAADQYSAAATLYPLLTGKPLYDGATDPTTSCGWC